jgi:putative ABC transport system permease protein
VHVLTAMTPPGTPLVSQVGLDARVLLFATALSVATGLLFGLAPALQLSRAGSTEVLRDGQRTTSARRGLRSALVIAELALALMLLVGAGLLVRSFARLQGVDPGFRPENTLAVGLLLPQTTYQHPASFTGFYTALLDRLERSPGVSRAGASTIIPLSGNNTDMSFIVEGRPMPDPGQFPVAWYRSITPGYFDAIGMRLLRGRGITAADRTGAPLAVVINETLAARYWPGEDPLGKRISSDSEDGPWATVVGIVADSRHTSLDAPPLAEMYLSAEQVPARGMTVVVRGSGDPLDLVPVLRAEVRALDPQLPLGAIVKLEDAVHASTALPRLYLSFFAFFAIVALVLAAVGIYGITSYMVTQRTREIGIRMALGAKQGDVLGLVLRHAAYMAIAGVAVGVVAAYALSHTLAALLYDLSPQDPATFATIAVLLAAVAIVASAVPALRAARVDPLVALRNE